MDSQDSLRSRCVRRNCVQTPTVQPQSTSHVKPRSPMLTLPTLLSLLSNGTALLHSKPALASDTHLITLSVNARLVEKRKVKVFTKSMYVTTRCSTSPDHPRDHPADTTGHCGDARQRHIVWLMRSVGYAG